MVSGADDGMIRIWDTNQSQPTSGSTGASAASDVGLMTPTVSLPGHEGKVARIVIEVAGGAEIGSGQGNGGGGVSAGGEWTGRVVSAGADLSVRLWDVRARRPQVFKFTGHTDVVTALLLDVEKVGGSRVTMQPTCGHWRQYRHLHRHRQRQRHRHRHRHRHRRFTRPHIPPDRSPTV